MCFIAGKTKFVYVYQQKKQNNRFALPSYDPLQRRPVIDLAKKELDWEP